MITGVNHLTLAVRDIEESFTFYHDVLGFTPIQKNPISAYLLAGEMWIALTLDAHARQEALPEYTHIAFTVAPADFDALKARLMQAGVPRSAVSSWLTVIYGMSSEALSRLAPLHTAQAAGVAGGVSQWDGVCYTARVASARRKGITRSRSTARSPLASTCARDGQYCAQRTLEDQQPNSRGQYQDQDSPELHDIGGEKKPQHQRRPHNVKLAT